MRLAIITSTRPELIRLSTIINKARKYYDVTHIYTNQNFDASLSTQFFDELDIEPDITFLNSDKLTGLNFIGYAMQLLQGDLDNIDAVLILGDTNGSFAAVSTAKRLGIPVFHMEAGNRCYDEARVPEEVNRRQIDAISDWHLCYTQRAREQLLLEGSKPERTIVVGNPIAEIINETHLEESNGDHYYLVTLHRKENSHRLLEILVELEALDKKVKISAHPSFKEDLEFFVEFHKFKNIELFTPCNFKDFLNLENKADCVITI